MKKMSLHNLRPCKYRLWIKTISMILSIILVMGCTKHELIDLPVGDVKGNVVFQDVDYNYDTYPDDLYHIKAQNNSNTYLALLNGNGDFSFSNLPMAGYNFSLIENDKELMSIKHCSFVGGGNASNLSFYVRIQPDIQSINYHLEIIEDTIWVFGKVVLDGTSPIEFNKIMLFVSFPPNNEFYYYHVVPFDRESKQIKYKLSKVYDLKSGDYINSYIYKKYRECSATFRNHVVNQHSWGGYYDDLNCFYTSASDSTDIYKFIVP